MTAAIPSTAHRRVSSRMAATPRRFINDKRAIDLEAQSSSSNSSKAANVQDVIPHGTIEQTKEPESLRLAVRCRMQIIDVDAGCCPSRYVRSGIIGSNPMYSSLTTVISVLQICQV